MARRIDFMIAGVQKGGTTALAAYIRQHPSITLGQRKEVHFFDKRPKTYIAWLDHWVYNRHFDWAAQARGNLLGEATPIYSWWDGAMERVWTYNRDIKIITVLRDPVERAWSHYRMDCRLGRETEDFSTVIRNERERARRALPRQDRVRSQVARGYYADQVRRLMRLFPDEQLLFLRSEDLAASAQTELGKVCDFLRVDRHAFEDEPGHNSARDDRVLKPEDRAYLEELYRFDAQETRRLLGWEKGPWSI